MLIVVDDIVEAIIAIECVRNKAELLKCNVLIVALTNRSYFMYPSILCKINLIYVYLFSYKVNSNIIEISFILNTIKNFNLNFLFNKVTA